MSIGPETSRHACAICTGTLQSLLELPGLPLTGLFARDPAQAAVRRLDQELWWCPRCAHAQLAYPLEAAMLYGEDYAFRSSTSASARAGSDLFLDFLERVAPGRNFSCVLDVGCNDLYLLRALRGRATRRVGVDPIWSGREVQGEAAQVTLIGAPVENIALASYLPTSPDLIVCRHTLEHLRDPRAVLAGLIELAADDGLILIEVPGLEGLIAKGRFDQIFHQHLHYFSRRSLMVMSGVLGASYLAETENPHHWSAHLIALEPRGARFPKIASFPYRAEEIRARYGAFRRDLARARELLGEVPGPLYGYGAAQMLPVLAYHMESELAQLTAILDDDPARQGLYYGSPQLAIRAPASAGDLRQASIFITALDSAGAILERLIRGPRPRHIVYPLHVI